MEFMLMWLGAIVVGLAIGAITGNLRDGALWSVILGPAGVAIFVGTLIYARTKNPTQTAR